jgi:hypothetical protein
MIIIIVIVIMVLKINCVKLDSAYMIYYKI